MIAEAKATVSTAFLIDHSNPNLEGIGVLDPLYGIDSSDDQGDELRWLNEELIDYYRLDSNLIHPAERRGPNESPSHRVTSLKRSH